MADTLKSVAENLTDKLNETAKNGTGKVPSTPEGMALAYSSLVIMAILPIFFGSFRSVKYHKEQKDSGDTPERMSNKDAAMFPIIASVTLFSIYLVFQIFSKEYINLLLTVYFFFLGIFALTHLFSPYINKLIPSMFPDEQYHILWTQGKPEEKKEPILDFGFSRKDMVSCALCTVVGIWYLVKRHWVANNLFGLAFAVNGVEFLQLNSVLTGCILLGGLFVYDIFWVFGTNVMVTVAKSFEAPIKLVFPQDILEKGLAANNFAMLGLGDIVIPGIFIALLLRFDVSQKKNSKTYFYTGFLAYCLGLLTTILVMHVFKHAQPALLYLVPACLGLPMLVALVKGDISAMLSYEDNPETEEEKNKKKEEEKKKDE